MADCTNCGQTPTPPCVDCAAVLETIKYCDDGCAEMLHSDCLINDNTTTIDLGNGVFIEPGESLTTIIKKLSQAESGITITADFNPTSRILTIKKNGATVASVTIPDSDDQYLELAGTKLQIWKPGATPLKINEVDLALAQAETVLNITSTSLTVIPGGIKGHAPQIEFVPSTDTGNAIIMGTDQRPYVPAPDFGVGDVVINNIPGINWTRVVKNGVISYTPVIDWQYFADQICPLCNPSCGAPSELTVQNG